MNPRVLAVVVTHNRFGLLQRCLNALEKQTAFADILVIDNASQDETAGWLDQKQQEGRLRVIHLSENSGGAGGFACGMKTGIEQGYDRLWLMDDDTFCKPDSLAELIQADQSLNGAFGCLSSAVLWKDGKECKMNRQKIKKAFYTEVERLRDGLILIDQATFVSLYVNTEAAIQLGLPIKEYFIWGDDIEYTLRLSRKWPCYLCGRSQVVHWMDHNTGSSIALDEPDRLDRYRYAFRNENFTARENGLGGIAYYLGKCGINLIRILRDARSHRLKRIGIVLGGMIRGLFFNPKIKKAVPLKSQGGTE